MIVPWIHTSAIYLILPYILLPNNKPVSLTLQSRAELFFKMLWRCLKFNGAIVMFWKWCYHSIRLEEMELCALGEAVSKATTFDADIRGPQKMNPTGLVHPLTFSVEMCLFKWNISITIVIDGL